MNRRLLDLGPSYLKLSHLVKKQANKPSGSQNKNQRDSIIGGPETAIIL